MELMGGMCGIAGVFGEAADKELVLRMLEPIRHRGRDAQGVYADKGITFGCNRLAIIDVPGGHQPISNEEGTAWVALNGEIYNHDELREELKSLGRQFKTRSDTEIIAQSYAEWGSDSFSRLNGMFGLALWDPESKALYLARDRVGVKPLYYAESNGNMLFASEFKAILGGGLLEHVTINHRILEQIIEVGYQLEPETLLNEVHQIPPGHYVSVSASGTDLRSFWGLPPLGNDAPSEETVRKVVRDSVVRQTITSDVPVGAFLSGGLDTSTVVAFASKLRPDGLKTFCMGFGEPTDEFADARIVAEAFGTEHHEITVHADDAMKLFPRMVWHSEAPKVNLYSWFVNEAASKYVKVCLSGLGGDELFGGYANTTRFGKARRIRRLRRIRSLANVASLIPSRRAAYVAALKSDPLACASLITGFPEREISLSVKSGVSPYFEESEDFVQELIQFEWATKLPYDYLLVEDAMSMAHTLEVRVPFLDNELIRLMLPVRHHHQMQGQKGKILLRRAMHGILPRSCLEKPKWGFSVDVYSWWRNGAREYACKYVPDSLFLKEHVPSWHERVKHYISLPNDPAQTRWYSMAWIMLGLEIWQRMFLDASTPGLVSW